MPLLSKSVGHPGDLPAGRYTKWAVLAVWLLVIVAAFSLAGRLSGAEKNKNTVELPRGAQSTYVAGVADRFPSGQVSPGIVVYVSNSGITSADRAKAQADRIAFTAHAAGPIGPVVPSADGKALQVTVPLHNNDSTLAADAGQIRSQAQGGLPPGLTAQLTGPATRWMPATRRNRTRRP